MGGASAVPNTANKAPSKIGPSKPTGVTSKSSGISSGSKIASKPQIGTKQETDVNKLNAEISDLRMNMDTVEKERDFYFGKLRDIELLLQANDTKKTPLSESVLKILYASEEEKVHIDD